MVTEDKAIISSDIPDSTFYGEDQHSPALELLHCEPLVERSRQHNWKINPHRHNGITQLFYVLQGEANAHLDGRLTQLTPPCILVVPEGCVHDFDWSENAEGHVLSVASPLLNRLAQPLGNADEILKSPAVYNMSEGGQLADSLFTAITRDYQQHLSARELMLETLLTALIIHLSRKATPNTKSQKRLDRSRTHFSSFTQLVERHYSDQWTVAKYAKRMGITPPHLNSICRKLSQQSALEIVHQRLLLEAKRSLTYTGRTIAEIAYQLGFSDPSHFTRFFKNKTGKNPKSFRDT
jgi:AraC family transcriptional activator of pobA